MKILLLGKDGQVGSQLQRTLSPLGDLTALGRRSSALVGDLSDTNGLARTVGTVCPDVIVNAAAYTQVDRAETDRAAAFAINATAPGALAEAAKSCGALLIHYSTDYVFDGSGSRPWREEDAPCPVNVYGQSKCAGEDAVTASGCRHVILRTSWIYDWTGINFPKTILRKAADGDDLNIVDDQIGAPTSAAQVADMTAAVITQTATMPLPDGLYHATASGATSWYDYARFLLTEARQLGITIRTGPDDVRPVPSAHYLTPARRPRNSRLDTAKWRATFGIEPVDWQTDLRRFLTRRP